MAATMLLRRRPLVDLLARYRGTFAAVWAARHELVGPERMADELAFLPAALSLQETPAHPAPRRAAWAVCLLFVIALSWAACGQVDIVAMAPGRIVVSERTKTLQPLEAGVVKRVRVRDGDSVVAGQVLVELDASAASADAASVLEQYRSAASEERRTGALTEALRANAPPVLPLLQQAVAIAGAGVDAHGDTRDSLRLQAEWSDIAARLAKLTAEKSRREAEAVTVLETIHKLESTLPLTRQREADIRSLTEQGFMSGHAGQDRTRDRIEMESDLATQRARLSEAHAALRDAAQARVSWLAETQRSLSERHAQAASKREQLAQEYSKTVQRTRSAQLTAPVDGTVQQLAVHTEGGVVTPAQVLMVIVPRDADVTAEVVIDNKDIGFVSTGQVAAIKLETFPFTRYGTVPATVKSVVADAVNDEKKGAIFPATLSLARASIDVDGKRILLSPGMNVSAEIKTGRRRVIEYLLSPIQRGLSDSFEER